MNYKLVKLENVHLVIHGCTDTLDYHEDIKDAWAIIEAIGEDYEIDVNGEPVSIESLPSVLRNARLDIVNDEADIVIYYPEKARICEGFTDGEYAYMACIEEAYIWALFIAHSIERAEK